MNSNHTWSRIHLVPFALLLVVLVGCGGSKDAARPIGVTLIGGSDLNDGNAATVRFYALGGDANFTRVPPGVFWQDDQAALGSELVGAAREVVLYPQSSDEIVFSLDATAQFVGVAANLRNPETDRWRAIVSAAAVRGNALRVSVGRSTLTLNVVDR